MFTRRRRHALPRLVTTGEVICWLSSWDSAAYVSEGALPARPWKRTPPETLESVADRLMQVRATFGYGRLGRDDDHAD